MHATFGRCILVSLAFAGAFVASASAQLAPLYPVPCFDGGGDDLVVVDMDLDGLPDVVTSGVSVTLGLPGGGFAAPVVSSLGLPSSALTVADMGGDGWPDVLGCGFFVQKFSILHGTGGAELSEPELHYVGGRLRGIAAGDLNADGLPDVVTASEEIPSALQVNMNDAVHSLLATVSYPQAFEPRFVQLADIDGDSDLDAAFLSIAPTSRFAVAWGLGTGAFAAPTVIGVACASGQTLLVRDLDADGDLDLAAACGSGSVQIVRGDGAGGLSAPETWPVGPGANDVDAGDLDDDGVLDLVTANFNSHDVSVLHGDGAGGYAPASTVDSLARIPVAGLLDASGDGLLDVVACSWSWPTLGVMLGDGAGGLLGPDMRIVDESESVMVADLDGDSHADIVSLANTLKAQVLYGDGLGGFGSPVSTGFVPGQKEPVDGAAGDVTGDGAPDVVCCTNGEVLLLRNVGGVLATPAVVSGSFRGEALELADLDGDGLLDALETHLPPGQSSPWPGAVACYLSAGAAGLQPPASFAAGNDVHGLAVGDLNEDGHPDAITADRMGIGVSVLEGDGAGGLLAATPFFAMPQQTAVAVGDLDLDGHLDVVGMQEGSGRMAVLRGDGAGGLALEFTTESSGSGVETTLALADLSGDGWPDVVQTGGYSSTLHLHRNDGAGGLVAPERFAAGFWPEAFAVADLDGDAEPDIVAANDRWEQISTLTILRHQGGSVWSDFGFAKTGSFGPPQLVGTGALTPGSPGTLRLFHARPLSPAVLFVSSTATPTPFKGGTLVPLPPLAQFLVLTDADGSLVLGWAAWPSAAPGQDWYFQYGIADAGASLGASLSNAVRAVEP